MGYRHNYTKSLVLSSTFLIFFKKFKAQSNKLFYAIEHQKGHRKGKGIREINPTDRSLRGGTRPRSNFVYTYVYTTKPPNPLKGGRGLFSPKRELQTEADQTLPKQLTPGTDRTLSHSLLDERLRRRPCGLRKTMEKCV